MDRESQVHALYHLYVFVNRKKNCQELEAVKKSARKKNQLSVFETT